MSRKIRDVLASRSEQQPKDRHAELASVSTCLQDAGPIVVWLYGPIGAGKTDLLNAFARFAEADGAVVVHIDCRTVEPTVSGFLAVLPELLDATPNDLEQAAAWLSNLGQRVVVALDNYEVFRLADSWLRREFIPALTETARVVLVSREPPAAGWTGATEWRDYFLSVSLDARAVQEPAALARLYLEEVPQADMRQALEAVAVVRRVTRPMLASLCPEMPTDALYDKMVSLSFVESRRDGLAIQDSVRKVIGDRLQAANIEQYRHYQQAAWKLLRRQLKESSRADLWRCTSDIIYLIQNPVIREAFFPSESATFSVEPAMPADKHDVLDIAEKHEPVAAFEALVLWWTHLPSAFHVVRDSAGTIVGFYCMAKPHELASAWMQSDPVARNWQHHLKLKGRLATTPSLFLRRWLSRDDGEAPSAVQAAAWVDIKRTYLELRPNLRRVYLTLQDIGPYGPVATELGFEIIEDLVASLRGVSYYTAMLDFGPGSVDGWICNLLGAELGVSDNQLLNSATRELVLNGTRIPLTPLEFSLLSMLESRTGAAVSRSELLQQVWKLDYDSGSNVVDAVVRGLRKKCGENARILETVRGIGYRLRI